MDNTSSLTDGFNQQNHLDAFVLHAYPDVADKLEEIKDRTQNLHLKLKAHHDKHWLIWVKKEQDRIFVEKFGSNKPQYQHPDFGRNGRFQSWDEARRWCFNEARARINSKISMSHDNLDIASKNMRNAVMEQARHRYQQCQSRQHLDRDVKDIHRNIHQQRMALYRDFEDNKSQRVEDARYGGSLTPEKDVYSTYKQQDNDILNRKEHLLTKAYEKHGFDYEMEKHDQVLTQNFNQKM